MDLDGIKREREREREWFGINFLYVINLLVLTIGHHVFRVFIDCV